MKSQYSLYAASLILVLTTSCSKSETSPGTLEDISASGAAATVVGGALSDSAGGTLALNSQKLNPLSLVLPNALASTQCPTYATAGAGCSASGSSLWLTGTNCSYGSSTATWNGTRLLKMSAGMATCGTFPNPGATATLTRQMVTAANSVTPGTLSRTSSRGTTVVIDDATANVGIFDTGTTVPTLLNGGYGTQVTFNGSGARSLITVNRREYAVGVFDHSVIGQLNVSEPSSGSSNRSVSGTLQVYHNGLKIIGSSVFTAVSHSDTCCVPVSGSVTTTFAAGAHVAPTALGAAIVGKSETLTFTGCGTANMQSANGTTTAVTLSNCF